MNKSLYNKRVKFPDEMKEHLKASVNAIQNANQYTEGFRRNQELQSQNSVTYQQLKRIKNFFDTHQNNMNDPAFVLNGGERMKGWTEGALRFLRDSIYKTKHNKSETGMENQHIDNHEKKGLDISPSKKHSKTRDRHDTAISESVKRINKLINY